MIWEGRDWKGKILKILEEFEFFFLFFVQWSFKWEVLQEESWGKRRGLDMEGRKISREEEDNLIISVNLINCGSIICYSPILQFCEKE